MSNREGGPIGSYDDLRFQRDMLGHREDAYLRRAGWRHTSSGNPGCHWVWEKTLEDGRVVLAGKALALSMAAHAEGYRCICEGYYEEPRCPIHGGPTLPDRIDQLVALARECLGEDDYIDSGDAANLANMVVEVFHG